MKYIVRVYIEGMEPHEETFAGGSGPEDFPWSDEKALDKAVSYCRSAATAALAITPKSPDGSPRLICIPLHRIIYAEMWEVE